MTKSLNLNHLMSLFLVISLGILSRTIYFNKIIVDKYLGDALYAIMIYLILRLFLPNKAIVTTSLITIALVIGIELFQLTGIPLTLRQSGNTLAYYSSIALGTKFSYLDILAYTIGIVSITLIDKLLFSPQEEN